MLVERGNDVSESEPCHGKQRCDGLVAMGNAKKCVMSWNLKTNTICEQFNINYNSQKHKPLIMPV